MKEQTQDRLWSQVAAEVRNTRKLRPLRLDEISVELRPSEPHDLTDDRISKVLAFATSKDSMPSADGRHASAESSVARLLEEVSTSGLVSAEEIRAVDESNAAVRRTSDNYVSEFTRRDLLRAYDPRRVGRKLDKGVLFADYLLLDTVGVGGMGEVFRALHLRMNRIVALKFVSAKASSFHKNLARFDSEVKALARLNHPNIVTAHDASESEGVPYLVMEYIDGSDLARLVYRLGPLNPLLAVSYLLQVARGLEYAHNHGVIHRDVKPSNILIDSNGVIKVSDLGLAKFVFAEQEEVDTDATAVGTAVGTYSYMSPEQAAGSSNVDARSDIYGLGCTLCFLLLGRPPAEGSTNEAKKRWHLEGVIPSLRTRFPELPDRVDAIFRRMLAKSPADRPQSMEEVVEELQACELLLRKSSGADLAATAEWPSKPAADATVEPARPGRWNHVLWIVILAMLAVLPAALLMQMFLGADRETAGGPDRETAGGVNKEFGGATVGGVAVGGATGPSSRPAALPLNVTNDVGMSLTLIFPGDFVMGDANGEPRERPRHNVHISQSFYMGTCEVNRRQYQEVMAPGQRIPLPDRRDDEPAAVDPGALPMVNVTWDEAREFCRLLSTRPVEMLAGRTYRLPTEAEWEYCCRAGTKSSYCTGDDITLEQANFGSEYRPPNIKLPGSPRLLEVGSLPANQFGLHDMHGNCLEWCKDRYGDYVPGDMTDPLGPKEGDQRVVRGGATTYDKGECRSAFRRYKHPTETNPYTGFRVVCVVKE